MAFRWLLFLLLLPIAGAPAQESRKRRARNVLSERETCCPMLLGATRVKFLVPLVAFGIFKNVQHACIQDRMDGQQIYGVEITGTKLFAD
jgi:hypothetical protein